jgi:hypothetical protein
VYTVSAANTWEQKSVIIAGDTSGTWNTGNDRGIAVRFSLGAGSSRSGTAGAWAGSDLRSATGAVSVVGTSGATFYITGVQLEKGSVATEFERRPFGTELQLAMRYFEKSYNMGIAIGTSSSDGGFIQPSIANGSGDTQNTILFKTFKRVSPSMTVYRFNGTSGSWDYTRSGASGSAAIIFSAIGEGSARVVMKTGGTWVGAMVEGHWTASAEL